MEFKKWLKESSPGFGYKWETYLDEIIAGGCVINHTDIATYMMIAFEAGQESVKGEKQYDQ